MQHDFHQYLAETKEVGFVDRVVSASLVYAQGLPGVKPQEIVMFESGELGQVLGIEENAVELLSFSRDPIRVGSKVVRANRPLEIAVGDSLLGAVVDPLGNFFSQAHPAPMKEARPVEIIPSNIQSRARITRANSTGVSLVDLILPLGKGQRELIIGDQKSGKSFFLVRSLLAQVNEGAVGVYAVVGKSKIAIRQIEETLRRMKIMEKIVMVASSADDAAGTIFLTPYAAMTIAEYFRDRGNDVLLVLDDLTTHAKAYREIALLGRRFPGRNSYPGDIFYAHARLLERAGNFKVGETERAITCLPVAEAVQGDITGYIQTNLMSMTDGHLYFDHRLFAEGRRPAIDPFLSVTRVGRPTQSPLTQEIGRTLLTFLKHASELHQFTSFGAELSENIRGILVKEARLLQFFDQTEFYMIPLPVEIFLFGIAWGNFLDDKPAYTIRTLMGKMITRYDADQNFRKKIDAASAHCPFVPVLLEQIRASALIEELLAEGPQLA